MSIQIPLLQHDVLPHDWAMRGHFLQCRQYAADVLIGIHKNDDDRRPASSIDQMAALYPLAAKESRDCVQSACGKNIFIVQIIQDGHVKRPSLPFVRVG